MWDKPSSWRTDCWQKSTCCCASGVGLDQSEAEQLAVNSSAIQKRLATHNQGMHVLELLACKEDDDDPDHPDIHTKVDKHHPLGPTCAFIDDSGACALHKLADDGIGRSGWGLKPEGCIMYPLVTHDRASLVENYGISDAQIGDDIEVLGFEASAEVALNQQCCFGDGDTAFVRTGTLTFGDNLSMPNLRLHLRSSSLARSPVSHSIEPWRIVLRGAYSRSSW